MRDAEERTHHANSWKQHVDKISAHGNETQNVRSGVQQDSRIQKLILLMVLALMSIIVPTLCRYLSYNKKEIGALMFEGNISGLLDLIK